MKNVMGSVIICDSDDRTNGSESTKWQPTQVIKDPERRSAHLFGASWLTRENAEKQWHRKLCASTRVNTHTQRHHRVSDAFPRSGKNVLDSAGETLVLLGIVVLQSNLQFHRLEETTFLGRAGIEYGLHRLVQCVSRDLRSEIQIKLG